MTLHPIWSTRSPFKRSAAEIFAEFKGALIEFQKFRGHASFKRILPRRFRYVKVVRQSSEQNNIDGFDGAGLSRECQTVHCVNFDSACTNFFDEFGRIFSRARDDGHRVDLLRVRDDLSAVFQTRR